MGLSITQKQYIEGLKTQNVEDLDSIDLEILDRSLSGDGPMALGPGLTIDQIEKYEDTVNKKEGKTELDQGMFHSMLRSWGAIAVGTIGDVMGGGFNPATTMYGAMAGEATQQAFEHMFKSEYAPQSIGESARRIGGEGIVGNIGTRVTQPLIPLLKGMGNMAARGGSAVANTRIPGTQMQPIRSMLERLKAPTGREMLPEDLLAKEAAERVKIPLTPFELKRMPILGKIETFATQGLISGNMIGRFQRKRVLAINSFRDSLTKMTGGIEKSHEALGEHLVNSVMLSLITTEKSFLKKLGLTTGEGVELLNTGGKFSRQWGEGAEEAYLAMIQETRRIRPELQGILKQMGISPKVTPKGMLKEMPRVTLQKSATTPGQIVDNIFIPNNGKNLSALKSMVGDDWNMYQRAMVEKLVGGETFNVAGLKKALAAMGDDTLKAVLDGPTIQGLKDLGEVGLRTGFQNLSTIGANRLSFNLVNIAEGGLAINTMAGAVKTGGMVGSSVKAIAFFLPAAAVAKLITSPAGVKYLTEGLKMSGKSPRAYQVARAIVKNLISVTAGVPTRGALTGQVEPRSIGSGRQIGNPFQGLLGGGANVQ